TARGGGTTEYRYDANRNLRFQIDANGRQVENVYDKLDRLTDSILADGQHWHYGYDANGNRHLIVDPLKQQTSVTFDYLNRLRTITYTGVVLPTLDYQPQSIDYQYDGNGNLLLVVEVKR